jgi:Cytosine deaminase and related metal-dependent hydrolases
MILLKNIQFDGSPVNLFIQGKRIHRILPFPETEGLVADETVDCTGKAVIPGFINMHTHAAMVLLRGITEDVPLDAWLSRIWAMEAKMDEDFIYWGTKTACLEMIRSGTTTFNDMYWFAPSAREAAREMGIRPYISFVILDQFDRETAEKQRRKCINLYERSLEWDEVSHLAMSVHSVYTVSEEMILWASQFAVEHGMKLHIHLSETEKENLDCKKAHGGLSPTEYLDSLGVLGPHVIAAHAIWLSDHDVEILGKHRVNCVHNINSNAKLASGYRFRYDDLKNAGANICLGTDGASSSNNLDMLETMKTTALFQKAWENDPSAMPLHELMDAATINGALALGLETGVIREGAIADLSIVDINNSYFISPGSFLANLVYAAHSDTISSVIANGRFVMRDRFIPGGAEILTEARKVLKQIQ